MVGEILNFEILKWLKLLKNLLKTAFKSPWKFFSHVKKNSNIFNEDSPGQDFVLNEFVIGFSFIIIWGFHTFNAY